jgi:hypothetical protein
MDRSAEVLELADRFRSLAGEFRAVQTPDDRTANELIDSVSEIAAKALKRGVERRLISWQEDFPWPAGPKVMSDDQTKEWSSLWLVIVQALPYSHPDELPSNPVAFRTTSRTESGEGPTVVVTGSTKRGDWPIRAKRYAAVCDWIARKIIDENKTIRHEPKAQIEKLQTAHINIEVWPFKIFSFDTLDFSSDQPPERKFMQSSMIQLKHLWEAASDKRFTRENIVTFLAGNFGWSFALIDDMPMWRVKWHIEKARGRQSLGRDELEPVNLDRIRAELGEFIDTAGSTDTADTKRNYRRIIEHINRLSSLLPMRTDRADCSAPNRELLRELDKVLLDVTLYYIIKNADRTVELPIIPPFVQTLTQLESLLSTPNADIPVFNSERFEVTFRADTIHFGDTIEFRLFYALLRKPGEYIPNARLIALAWKEDPLTGDKAVQQRVHQLKKKFLGSAFEAITFDGKSRSKHYRAIIQPRGDL